MTRSYGTGVSLASALSTPTISALSTQETKSAYTLSASTLIAFLNTAQTGQTNPYTNSNEPRQIFFNIGMFLQAPNGFNSMSQYEIVAATINWGGVVTFFGSGSFVTPNFPQQNSLAVSTDYPAPRPHIHCILVYDFFASLLKLSARFQIAAPPQQG